MPRVIGIMTPVDVFNVASCDLNVDFVFIYGL